MAFPSTSSGMLGSSIRLIVYLPVIRYCFSTFHKDWDLVSSSGQLPPSYLTFGDVLIMGATRKTPAKALGPVHTAVKKSSRI